MRQTEMQFTVKSYYSATARKAFTLIELLVVIAIIGVLATILIVFYDNAQANGRDTRRIADLSTIADAGSMYRSENTSYEVLGTGHLGTSQLLFNFTGTDYPISINRGLITAGYLPGEVVDPTGSKSKSDGLYFYMYCQDNTAGANKLSVYARLEKGTAAQLDQAKAGFDGDTVTGSSYSMNYTLYLIP